MKNLFKSLVMLLAVGLALTFCTKDEPAEQQQNLQPTHELGALLLPAEEYAKIPVVEIPDIDLKSIPASVNLVTPPVGDQGGEGSCVAWGTTYAGRSINWYTTKTPGAVWSQSANIFSPEFVYNQIKVSSSCGSGAYVTSGLNLLKSKGVCTWTSMPYTDASCSLKPNATQLSEALTYKITGYSTVSRTTTQIKAQLVAGKPVIVAGPVDKGFVNLAADKVLTNRKGSLGGHCYCVVGYDDSKSAFKFINSWGTGWASSGYGWISYSYIGQWWQEAYVIN